MSLKLSEKGVRTPIAATEPHYPWRELAFAIACFAAGLLSSFWFYRHSISLGSLTMALPMIWAALSGLLVLASSTFFLHRCWTVVLARHQEEGRRALATAQMQIAELQAVAQQLSVVEEEKTELQYAKAQLEAELDTLKRSQKTLLWRRQELESSKTVLELHVQERSEEVQRLQRQYELILNSAGEGICGLDLNGKTTFVNPAAARMTGWSAEELIGKSEQEIFGDSPLGPKDSAHIPEERIFRRKNGNPFPVECIKTPLDENGRVVGAVLIFKDITQRRRVEEAVAKRSAELAQSNAELEQFAFVASHDLQEPLRKIQAFGDRLKTKLDSALGPEARDYLERMQSASARMRTLINDLLTFSRVIRRSEPFVPVDLNQVAKGVLGDLEVRIEKSGARVDLGELPQIEADPIQMQQLILNLVGNALKFQPKDNQPVVKIRSRTYTTLSGQDLCEITVTDNGIGFEEKYLEKMFAVFQRLHGRNEYEGTGVGLAVCRRITDRHHGTITAKSEPGNGATFIITLPVRQDNHDRPVPRPANDTVQLKRTSTAVSALPEHAAVPSRN